MQEALTTAGSRGTEGLSSAAAPAFLVVKRPPRKGNQPLAPQVPIPEGALLSLPSCFIRDDHDPLACAPGPACSKATYCGCFTGEQGLSKLSNQSCSQRSGRMSERPSFKCCFFSS